MAKNHHGQKKENNSNPKGKSQIPSKQTEQKSQSKQAVSFARKLDSRQFSQEAHSALTHLKGQLDSKYHGNASNLVRGLTAYISTWGLHRLSGDAKKFLNGTASDTQYKGTVYRHFLERLKIFSGDQDFEVDQEDTLINLDLRKYTTLNRLAIQLAKEWSFWAVAVLGEPKVEQSSQEENTNDN